MMREWSAARQRVQEVKVKDAEEGEKMSKEITSVSISADFFNLFSPVFIFINPPNMCGRWHNVFALCSSLCPSVRL